MPEGLSWWRGVDGGAAWLDRLPAIVAECAETWSLEIERPFEPARISLVLAVRVASGEPAVLKVNFPEPESEHEAAALARWGGAGAARLLRSDDSRRALLVERCQPGDPLWSVADEEEANAIAASVLRRLWRPLEPGHPFRLLADEAEQWASSLPAGWERFGRPYERALLDEAVATCRELGPSQGELVVCHQDFHGGNLLRATREPWLAIDPKPLAGEREFDVASLVRDRRDELVRDPGAGRRVRRRLDQLAAELDLDRERARLWGIAHALAWAEWEEGIDPQMVACARWLAEIRSAA